jgi:hypothetical protein
MENNTFRLDFSKEDIQEWLKSIGVGSEDVLKKFTKYDGIKIAKLTKEDFKELVGTENGILLFHEVQQVKDSQARASGSYHYFLVDRSTSFVELLKITNESFVLSYCFD